MARHRGLIVIVASAIALLAACSGSEEGPSANMSPSWTRISSDELDTMLQSRDVFLVNVHVPYEGEIPGTDAFIPYDEIASHIDELPSDPSTLVIYCRSGNMSTVAANELVAEGVTGFSELAGGYTAWTEAGLPFEVGSPTG